MLVVVRLGSRRRAQPLSSPTSNFEPYPSPHPSPHPSPFAPPFALPFTLPFPLPFPLPFTLPFTLPFPPDPSRPDQLCGVLPLPDRRRHPLDEADAQRHRPEHRRQSAHLCELRASTLAAEDHSWGRWRNTTGLSLPAEGPSTLQVRGRPLAHRCELSARAATRQPRCAEMRWRF